jgi:hypothetical protein
MLAVIAGPAGLAGCDDLAGLDETAQTPLASVHVRVTGDLASVRDPASPPAELRVGLQWAVQGRPDRSCLPPVESPEHAAVVAVGCPDPLGFVRGFSAVGEVAVDADATATIDLLTLPSYLVGDTYAQIAYASVFVYDVQEGSPGDGVPPATVLYGASLLSMAKPDTRLAFRHGGYNDQLAFYPRRGCAAPPEGFSLVSAGGFTVEQAVEAQARGELPSQNPADCRVETLDHVVEVALRPPEEMQDLGCFSSSEFYGPPDRGAPVSFDPSQMRLACTSMPDFGTGQTGKRQALAAPSMPPKQGCKYVQHFILRGCYADPYCDTPDWDVPPPSWWPCPADGEP